jgi:hypothetical protein
MTRNSIRLKTFHLLLLLLINCTVYGQSDTNEIIQNSKNKIYRDFQYILSPNWDLYNSSINTRTTGKILNTAFSNYIAPKIKNNTVRNISEGVWSFGTTFYTMLMGHEFGHMLKAKEIGGNFKIQKFSFPVIYGEMNLPPNATLEETTRSVSGGFEVNYLMVRDIQLDLYKYQRLHNDELSLSFANRILFPIYFSLIAPVDPNKSETWTQTMGDPVHWAKPVWERSGNPTIQADGTVNPQLSKFYKNSAVASIFWNLADLNFYKEVSSLFGSNSGSQKSTYIIGDQTNGWGYGTHFNTSVLGAELNMTNYFRLNQKLYTLSLRYGFPFQNFGLGIAVHDILKQNKNINFDLLIDLWDQEYYSKGFAVAANTYCSLNNQLDFIAQTGYKTRGYMIGKIIDQGFIGYLGLRYKL